MTERRAYCICGQQLRACPLRGRHAARHIQADAGPAQSGPARHPVIQPASAVLPPLARRIAARETEPERTSWRPVWMRRDNARVLDHGAGR